MKNSHLVIGAGEVGTAIAHNLVGARYNVDISDKVDGLDIDKTYDVLHVCFPYTDKFLKYVREYQRHYEPTVTIIYSTVPVGTTKKLSKTIHSPVEGKHPNLSSGVKLFRRYIGYNHLATAQKAEEIWEPITEVRLVKGSDSTEFLKLASTSKYGINIVWAQYVADVAKKIGMDYELAKEWDTDYNAMYKSMKKLRYRKFVLDPPEGKIGGHCVVPNAVLLDKQYPSDMLKMIKEMG